MNKFSVNVYSCDFYNGGSPKFSPSLDFNSIKDSFEFNFQDSEPTNDEKRIANYLIENNIKLNNVLHVGIGSNLFFRLFPNIKITGVTLSFSEYEKALCFKSDNYKVILFDKYNPRLINILDTYDYIIDININSFRCCDEHAYLYLKNLVSKLNPNGKILSDTVGWRYGFNGRWPLDLNEICKFANAKYSIVNETIVIEKE